MTSRMRTIRRTLATLALGGAVAFAIAVPGRAEGPRAASTFQSGAFAQSNSSEGSAILSMANMRPGDSVTGTVGIANDGDLRGTFTLASTIDADQPGVGGGDLASVLALVVTDAGSGHTIYSGTVAGLASAPLGDFSAGESRSYRFTVTLPAGSDNSVAGGSVTARYSWTAESTDTGTTETTPPPTSTTPPPPTDTGTTNTPPPPPPPPPPVDRTPPRLALAGAASQKLTATYVTAGCDEPCVLTASATVTGVRGVRPLPMAVPAKAIAAGQQVRLVAKPAGKAAKLIAAALKQHKKVKIVVKVQAQDVAHNAASGSRTLSLRR